MLYVGNTKYKLYTGSTRRSVQVPRLPHGYKECDWIASASNCYIDTGVHVNADYTVEVVAKIYKYADGGYQTLFGTRNGQKSRFTMRDNNNSTQLGFQRSTNADVDVTFTEYSFARTNRIDWHTYGIYKNLGKIDGETVVTFAESTGLDAFSKTLYISALNSAGSAVDWGFYYLRSAKIWDDSGIPVRDYVPAYETATSKFGMFDLVTRVFYSSESANQFIGHFRNAGLPSEYTELDFVRFTGDQYLIIPDTVSPTDCFEAEWKWNATTAQQVLFSAGTQHMFYINGNNLNAFNYGDAENWVSIGTKADLGHCYMKMDGVNKSLSVNCHNTAATIDLSSYTASGTESGFIIGKRIGINAMMDLYSFNRYEDGVLARNFIPCHNNHLEHGLYDLVNQEFFKSSTTVGLEGGYLRD